MEHSAINSQQSVPEWMIEASKAYAGARWMSRPFRFKEWLCICNGYVLTALRSDAVADDRSADLEKLGSVLTCPPDGTEYDLPALCAWIQSQETVCSLCRGTKQVKCGNCHGRKRFSCECSECGNRHDAACDQCDDHGMAECQCERSYNPLILHSQTVDFKLLHTFKHIDGSSYMIANVPGVLVLGTDEWRICVMPLRIDSTEGLKRYPEATQ
jgi:hypothetical protein